MRQGLECTVRDNYMQYVLPLALAALVEKETEGLAAEEPLELVAMTE